MSRDEGSLDDRPQTRARVATDGTSERFAGSGYVRLMGILKKVAALGIAKKVYDEARKPHNQAKIREATRKVQERRQRGRHT